VLTDDVTPLARVVQVIGLAKESFDTGRNDRTVVLAGRVTAASGSQKRRGGGVPHALSYAAPRRGRTSGRTRSGWELPDRLGQLSR